MVTVYAQDASGRTTDVEERDTVTVDVSASTAPDISMRVDDLSTNKGTKFITSVSVSGTDEYFERIEVGHASLTNTWADTQQTINARRGSVTYEEGGTEGNAYEITVRVIHANRSGEFVATERTIKTVANTLNSVEEDVSLSSSPILSSPDILDRSNRWNGA